MKRTEVKIYFSVVTDEHGEFKAMIPIDVMRRQTFYLMDEQGQHEYVPMDFIHAYHYVGNAISKGSAHLIKSLLSELNTKDDEIGSSMYINVFNTAQKHYMDAHDRRFLNASCKSVRFTEKGFYF